MVSLVVIVTVVLFATLSAVAVVIALIAYVLRAVSDQAKRAAVIRTERGSSPNIVKEEYKEEITEYDAVWDKEANDWRGSATGSRTEIYTRYIIECPTCGSRRIAPKTSIWRTKEAERAFRRYEKAQERAAWLRGELPAWERGGRWEDPEYVRLHQQWQEERDLAKNLSFQCRKCGCLFRHHSDEFPKTPDNTKLHIGDRY